MTSRMIALMRREWGVLSSDWRLLLIVFLMPFVYMTLIGSLYAPQRVKNVPTYLIDEDDSVLSRSVGAAILSSETFKVVRMNATVEEFKAANRRDEAFACVVIPKNFQNDVKRGRTGRLLTLVDGANLLVANTVRGGIAEIAGTYGVGVLAKRLAMRGAPSRYSVRGSIPIEAQVRVLYVPTFSYAAFVLPGLWGAVLQQICLLGVALAFSREREKKLFPKILEISRSPFEVLAAKAGFYTGINLFTAFGSFMLLGFFGVNVSGSIPLFMFLTFAFVIAVVAVGVLLSAALGDQLFATEALMLLSLPSFLLSGFSWPQFAMTRGIRWICERLPLTHFIMPLRSVIYQNAGMADIAKEAAWLWTCAVVCYALAYLFVWRLMSAAARESAPKTAAPVELKEERSAGIHPLESV